MVEEGKEKSKWWMRGKRNGGWRVRRKRKISFKERKRKGKKRDEGRDA